MTAAGHRSLWSSRRVDVPGGVGFSVYTTGSGPPHVTVLAGIHGDEPEGVLAARGLIGQLALERGTLTVVPVCNEDAFAASQRRSAADDGDLARAFPGDPAGSPTARLAAAIAAEVLAATDVLIDLHTGGRHYDMPLLVGYGRDGRRADEAAALARAFGAPVVWASERLSPGRTLSVVSAAGGVALYAEGPGGEQVDTSTVQAYRRGVLAVLAELGLRRRSGAEVELVAAPLLLGGSGNLDTQALDAERDGLFVRACRAGERVAAGQPIGTLLDVEPGAEMSVRAPVDGCIVYVRRSARVRRGDALFALAPVLERD